MRHTIEKLKEIVNDAERTIDGYRHKLTAKEMPLATKVTRLILELQENDVEDWVIDTIRERLRE